MIEESDRSIVYRRRIGYQDLMRHRVQNILLVSTLYDSFILAEDGQLHKAILHEFIELNLSNNPAITWVSSGPEAVELAHGDLRFDLVITSLYVGDMDALELARLINDGERPRIPVVLLTYNNRELTAFRSRHDIRPIDKIFLWQGDVRILLAIVKFVEDRLNAAYDIGVAGVPAILLVEDNVRYYSSFLPAIYTQLVVHLQQVLSEALNMSQKLLRMRARPKVLLCETYEEAWDWFSRYADGIIGVISDIEFPWKGALHPQAGLELARRIRDVRDDLPMVLQSSIESNKGLADSLNAEFLLKGAPNLVHEIRRLIRNHLGFGDFIFKMDDGSEVVRASDLREMIWRLGEVPIESIRFHARRHDFSSWLKARGDFALAQRLRPRTVAEYPDDAGLRDALITVFSDYRRERDRIVVADFDRGRLDSAVSVSRIGGGSLGGKARGLAFANRLIADYEVAAQFPDIDVLVPESVVIGTEVFERFMEQADLRDFALRIDVSDRDVLARFEAADFPEDVHGDLAAFLGEARYPLAVRSSSLLEDSPHQPFAGIYETYMLANNHANLEVRLALLVSGVKRVWASTFLQKAKEFLPMTPYHLEEERMAVIVQRIVGTQHDDRYYPSFAGVARSHNFYPAPPQEPEDGIAAVALGMGKTVVEGGSCIRFSPRYPRAIVDLSDVASALETTQRQFFALDLNANGEDATSFREADLKSFGLEAAESDGTLPPVGSTYDADNKMVYDGIARQGVRLVTFAGVLKHGAFPLAKLLDVLLRIGSDACSGPVEIEFAVKLPTTPESRPEFGFLQMRPLVISGELEAIEIGEVADSDCVCRSSCVLGNGRVGDLKDIVVVDRKTYDRSRSREVAAEVSRINAAMLRDGIQYVLVGVGRWGSADPFLGIPVSWNQIAGARVIVEAGFEDLAVSPSQGTHFFQNLASCDVGYFTVNPEVGEGLVDWDWLRLQDPVHEAPMVRHVRLAEPLVVKMDGQRGEGVILKPNGGRERLRSQD